MIKVVFKAGRVQISNGRPVGSPKFYRLYNPVFPNTDHMWGRNAVVRTIRHVISNTQAQHKKTTPRRPIFLSDPSRSVSAIAGHPS
jgi:hypothetical protein